MNPDGAPQKLTQLLSLGRQARQAGSAAELAFLAVNDTQTLVAYRQSALWFPSGGVRTLSGVMQMESNAPYVQFLNRLCDALQDKGMAALTKDDLPGEIAKEWDEWLPPFLIWLPMTAPGAGGGLIFAREMPWTELDKALLAEWGDVWKHAWAFHRRPQGRTWRETLAGNMKIQSGKAWWRQKPAHIALGVLLVLLMPVRLSILAPGELVPAHPAVVRSPMDGIIEQIEVEPNQQVEAGQALFRLDATTLKSRLQVAKDTLTAAEAEYRQSLQMAIDDEKAKARLSSLKGKIDVAKSEAEFLTGRLADAQVAAPQAGTVLFDDPSEWIGKPVSTGERVMRIATPGDAEIEAWIPVGDAIPLEGGAPVQLYLNANPLSPVKAKLRYIAFGAVQRPTGGYAYRVAAALTEKTDHRVGLKGTARLSGRWVPLAYWVFRRPLAALRGTIGW